MCRGDGHGRKSAWVGRGLSGISGMELWNGIVEWNSGMEYWNAIPVFHPNIQKGQTFLTFGAHNGNVGTRK